jgi:outer membrane lipoprotein-sorting protein
LSFDSYKKTEEAGAFPYLRRIEAFSPETGAMRLQIKFENVAFNVQPKFRFEIPDHYTRVEND